MVNAVLGSAPKSPAELNPRVPQRLSDVCMRMLDKNPDDRFHHMNEVALACRLTLATSDESRDLGLADGTAPDFRTTDAIPALAPKGTLEREQLGGAQAWKRLRMGKGPANTHGAPAEAAVSQRVTRRVAQPKHRGFMATAAAAGVALVLPSTLDEGEVGPGEQAE